MLLLKDLDDLNDIFNELVPSIKQECKRELNDKELEEFQESIQIIIKDFINNNYLMYKLDKFNDLLFENIVNNESIAKKNWRLMYLDTNNLSHEQIKKIEFLLEKSEPPRDKLKLIKIFRDFGINNFDIDTFFSSISSIKVKNDRR